MRNEQVEKIVEFLRENVKCYPQVSDDEPGGYCSEIDQRMDEAADLLERLQSRIEALEKELSGYKMAELTKLDQEFCFYGYTAMQSEKGGV